MAKLTKKGRSNIKTSKFGVPSKRIFPEEDKSHARAAELDAPAAERKGTITPMQRAMIDRKARKVLAGK